MSKLEIINAEINQEINKEEVQRALIATTFKGFSLPLMKQALMEGMIRGFTFQDFLEKNVYAIKYGEAYSLITSIDYARKIGMRNSIVGKLAPTYEENADGTLKSCTVTVKRKIDDYIGEYTATVFFDEYTTGRNLWLTKPRTMLAKVAEMHALRMACPEELAKAYVEEEIEREKSESKVVLISEEKLKEFKDKLEVAATPKELSTAWAGIPAEAKEKLKEFKDELKEKLKVEKGEPTSEVTEK